MYLYWRSFAITWKKDTSRALIRCAYTVCLNDNLLQEELRHIETHFHEINGHSEWLLKQTFEAKRSTKI